MRQAKIRPYHRVKQEIAGARQTPSYTLTPSSYLTESDRYAKALSMRAVQTTQQSNVLCPT